MANPNTAARVLEVARGELGTIGGEKYIAYYNQITGAGLPLGAAWCAAWVTYVMRHAGVPTDSVLNYKGCATASEWFAARGRFRPRSGGYVPKPGDIIMYEWSPQNEGTDRDDGDDHTGLVEYVESGMVHTVEGNNNGVCRRSQRSLSDPYISGYCVPLYNMKEEKDMTREETLKLIQEQQEKIDPMRHNLKDVPSYWRDDVARLIAAGAICGDGVHEVEKRDSQIAAMVVMKRLLENADPVYRTIDDVPRWGRPAVQALIDSGKLVGEKIEADGTRVLNLRLSTVRIIKMLTEPSDGQGQSALAPGA